MGHPVSWRIGIEKCCLFFSSLVLFVWLVAFLLNVDKKVKFSKSIHEFYLTFFAALMKEVEDVFLNIFAMYEQYISDRLTGICHHI